MKSIYIYKYRKQRNNVLFVSEEVRRMDIATSHLTKLSQEARKCHKHLFTKMLF